MIRTLCTLAAATLAVMVLMGCDGGVDRSDAPKGGAKRPQPTETIKPASPGLGATESDQGNTPPTTSGDE